MVRTLLYLIILFPIFIFSAEFTAEVSENRVGVGESFTLTLTLKDASPQGVPGIDALRNWFYIHSQHQSSNMMFINGNISSSITWKIVLIPQKEGKFVIPAINIETSQGSVLSSQPMTIQVSQERARGQQSSTASSLGLTLTAFVSHAEPYKNEPIIYTARLTSKYRLNNVKMEKLQIEDGSIEPNGEPKIFEKLIDGTKRTIVDFSYIITPFKTGEFKIPSVTIHGAVPVKRKTHDGGFDDDDINLFSMLQGYDRLKPFAMATQEISLQVAAPAYGDEAWLPARSLKIEEIWDDSQSLQVGEPLTRSFKIVAEGMRSNQLPSLNDLQIQDSLFRVYADKPELTDELKEGGIQSSRKEKYTLIPQKAGTLVLPEISVSWWDVVKKEKATARIPVRVLQILPNQEVTQKILIPVATTSELTSSPPPIEDPNVVLLLAVMGLILLLLVAIFWVVLLQKKIKRLIDPRIETTTNTSENTPKIPFVDDSEKKKSLKDQEKNEKLPDLNPT